MGIILCLLLNSKPLIAALVQVVEHCNEIRGDVSQGLIVGGLSAGGNIAAVLALIARDDPEFYGRITGQVLQVPGLCTRSVIPAK
jgi:acetyl esterase/lipase